MILTVSISVAQLVMLCVQLFQHFKANEERYLRYAILMVLFIAYNSVYIVESTPPIMLLILNIVLSSQYFYMTFSETTKNQKWSVSVIIFSLGALISSVLYLLAIHIFNIEFNLATKLTPLLLGFYLMVSIIISITNLVHDSKNMSNFVYRGIILVMFVMIV